MDGGSSSAPWRAALLLAAALIPAGQLRAAEDDLLAKDPAGRLSTPLFRIASAVARGDPLAAASRRLVGAATGRVTAVAVLAAGADPVLVAEDVRALGGSVSGIADDLMRVHLPPASLARFSHHEWLRFLRLPMRPRPAEAISEGVGAIHAGEFVARTGVDGRGVRVGVLDIGFERADKLVGTELPEDTIFTDSAGLESDSDSPRHGTACAEIVHDVAPGAQLVLAQVNDEIRWRQAIDQLLALGVKVITASIAFPNSTAPDGRGYYAWHVDRIAAQDVLWINAAGNYTSSYHKGPAADTDGDGLLEFRELEMVPIRLARGEASVSLRWNEPYDAAGEDYDLLVVTEGFRADPRPTRDNPSVLAASADPQNGTGYPYEWVELDKSVPRDVYAVVVKRGGLPMASGRRFSIWVDGDVLGGFATPEGSIAPPADAQGALAVAAVAAESGALRGYSSRGPTDDGRTKPDLAGPDGVTTAAYSYFDGTSAATPHVAGAAALLWSRNRALGVADLRRALEKATSSQGVGKNNDTGYGFLDLNRVQ
jgi:subtilisin family serine protease